MISNLHDQLIGDKDNIDLLYSISPDMYEQKRNTLALGMGITNITGIDPVAGVFEASFLLRLVYQEDETFSFEGDELTEEDCKNRPQIDDKIFKNAKEISKLEINAVSVVSMQKCFGIGSSKADRLVRLAYMVSGTFYEEFELEMFPYDVQNLSVIIRSYIGHKYWDLVPMEKEINFKFQFSLPDFRIYEPPMHNLQQEESNAKATQLLLTTVVERKSFFFEFNIILITFVCTSLVFMTFQISAGDDGKASPDNLADMAGVTLTLLLTTVAFRLVVADKLPAISYSTVLDKYLTGSFACLIVVIIENSIAVASYGQSSKRNMVALIIIGLWILFNLVYLWRSRQYISLVRKVLTQEHKLKLMDEDAGHEEQRVKYTIL